MCKSRKVENFAQISHLRGTVGVSGYDFDQGVPLLLSFKGLGDALPAGFALDLNVTKELADPTASHWNIE